MLPGQSILEVLSLRLKEFKDNQEVTLRDIERIA